MAKAILIKTCYYEILAVEKTATEDDIKKAYRKVSLHNINTTART